MATETIESEALFSSFIVLAVLSFSSHRLLYHLPKRFDTFVTTFGWRNDLQRRLVNFRRNVFLLLYQRFWYYRKSLFSTKFLVYLLYGRFDVLKQFLHLGLTQFQSTKKMNNV